MEINIDGYTYYFKNEEQLEEKVFIDRCWYIARNKPKDIESFNKFEKYSRVWSNMNNLNCRYNSELEELVKKYS